MADDQALTVVKSEPLPTLTVADEQPATEPSAPEGKPGTSAGLTLAAIGKMTPAAAWQLLRFGTSPTAAKTGGTLARVGTTVGAAAHGLATGNLSEVIAAPMAGWAAGKGGYFGTQMLQAPARVTSALLEKAAPVISKMSGVQGALDLAQMAAPERRDIGFMGIGGSMAPIEVLQKAVANGANAASAAAALTKGDPKAFGELMTAYMKSRQVK